MYKNKHSGDNKKTKGLGVVGSLYNAFCKNQYDIIIVKSRPVIIKSSCHRIWLDCEIRTVRMIPDRILHFSRKLQHCKYTTTSLQKMCFTPTLSKCSV